MSQPSGEKKDGSSTRVAELIEQIDSAAIELRKLAEGGVEPPETLADGFRRVGPVRGEESRLLRELGGDGAAPG